MRIELPGVPGRMMIASSFWKVATFESVPLGRDRIFHIRQTSISFGYAQSKRTKRLNLTSPPQ
jgi:hypothetical protein